MPVQIATSGKSGCTLQATKTAAKMLRLGQSVFDKFLKHPWPQRFCLVYLSTGTS
jgi:hypothetical protein